MILYIYPRSHTIDAQYNGCQNEWFMDDDHFRKLSVTYYTGGVVTAYDNINLNGAVGYHCQYSAGVLVGDNDGRCPDISLLKPKTYQAGCYSKSKLNSSDLYEPAFADCELK